MVFVAVHYRLPITEPLLCMQAVHYSAWVVHLRLTCLLASHWLMQSELRLPPVRHSDEESRRLIVSKLRLAPGNHDDHDHEPSVSPPVLALLCLLPRRSRARGVASASLGPEARLPRAGGASLVTDGAGYIDLDEGGTCVGE